MPFEHQNPTETLDHVCARCLEPVSEDAESCPGCQASFAGCGRFLRLYAPRETRMQMVRGASSRSWRSPTYASGASH